jgi:hypothetical protein
VFALNNKKKKLVFAQVKFPFENEGSIGTIYTIVRSRLESRGELGKAGKGKPKEDNDSTSYSTFLCFGRWEYIYITGSAAPHRPCLSALQGCDLVSLYQENKHASLEKKMLWDTVTQDLRVDTTCIRDLLVGTESNCPAGPPTSYLQVGPMSN